MENENLDQNDNLNERLRYQDYVIKDGKLIGRWESLYKTFDDPWFQSEADSVRDSRRVLSINWCRRLRERFNVNRVIEVGCGFGFLTAALANEGFSVVGIDVSKTAIKKARLLNKHCVFLESDFANHHLYSLISANIYIMSEVTWYVLDHLKAFLRYLREEAARGDPIFLIHLLATYPNGNQRYGTEFFTNIDEINSFFDLEYLEYGFIKSGRSIEKESQGTFFIAKVPNKSIPL